jgi:hypothetical protein
VFVDVMDRAVLLDGDHDRRVVRGSFVRFPSPFASQVLSQMMASPAWELRRGGGRFSP